MTIRKNVEPKEPTVALRRSSRLKMANKVEDIRDKHTIKDIEENMKAKNETKKRKKNIKSTPVTESSFSNNDAKIDLKAKREIQKDHDDLTKKEEIHETTFKIKEKKHDPLLLLMDLGTLVKGELIKRPSSKIRSPYVADVKILNSNNNHDSEEKNEIIVQAHAPALDVGGLCGAGAIVYMSERAPGGKTSHAIELVLAPGPQGDADYVLVGCHPALGEKLAEEVLKRGLMEESLGFGTAELKSNPKSSKKKPASNNASEPEEEDIDTTILYRQRTYGDSRIDFEIVSGDKDKASSCKRALIEVKNVVCSDYDAQYAPTKTGPNHCVIMAPETITEREGKHQHNDSSICYNRSGIFPWGRVGQTFEGKKVVSERAIKHLRNLAKLNNMAIDKTSTQTNVLFVINRSDCDQMRSCHEACPVFASELKAASEKGVGVFSFSVHWTESGKAYFDGIIPVSVETYI
jgi:DNA-binding sugar fermentation-stimulating protein